MATTLIVEDDRLVALMLDRVLSSNGRDVCVIHSASDAWDVLSSAAPPLAALIEWSMPDIGGAELCRRFRARKDAPFVYLILMSGRFSRRTIAAGLDAGADEYIAKPFHAENVTERLEYGVGVARRHRGILCDGR